MYDFIIENDLTASKAAALDALDAAGAGDVVNILINSGGGDVFTMRDIIHHIQTAQARGARVCAFVDGVAASAAAVICLYCDEVTAADYSQFLFHGAMMEINANAAQMLDAAQMLEELDVPNIEQLKKKTGLDDEAARALFFSDTWKTPRDLPAGIVNKITNFEGNKKICDIIDNIIFNF